MTRHLSIDDAATALGVSRKTIERRLKSGTLSGHLDGRRWLVDVSDEVVDGTPEAESETPPAMSQTGPHVADMSATVATLQATLAEVRNERDYLRQTVDRLLTTNALLVQKLETPALPAPTPNPQSGEPPPATLPTLLARPWWQFWRARGTE